MPYPRRHRKIHCPVCGGKISSFLLDWHLTKYHEDERPMALELDDAARRLEAAKAAIKWPSRTRTTS